MPSGTTSRQIAESIGAGLARAAVAAKVNGTVWDIDRPIDADATLAILTERDPEALELLRHSSAHILATAVRELFPSAGIGFGPPIEDGFYYDFQVDRPFTPEDLERLEAKMAEVAARTTRLCARWWTAPRPIAASPTIRSSSSGSRARPRRDHHRLHRRAVHRPLPRPAHSRAPAGSSTSSCSAAGAYWRGDEHRQMLQRIYGTAFFDKKGLDAWLKQREEAEKRDHRRLGKELDLFLFHPFAPGRGVLDRRRAPRSTRCCRRTCATSRSRTATSEIKTPLLYNKGLWEMSGPLGQVQGEHVPGARQRDRRARLLAQADELPVAPPVLRLPRSTAIATCRCASTPTTCCTATRWRARSAG